MSQQSKIVPVHLTDKSLSELIQESKLSLICKLTMAESVVCLYSGTDKYILFAPNCCY